MAEQNHPKADPVTQHPGMSGWTHSHDAEELTDAILAEVDVEWRYSSEGDWFKQINFLHSTREDWVAHFQRDIALGIPHRIRVADPTTGKAKPTLPAEAPDNDEIARLSADQGERIIDACASALGCEPDDLDGDAAYEEVLTLAVEAVAERMRDVESQAKWLVDRRVDAVPVVPEGHEVVVLPTEVVDAYAHRSHLPRHKATVMDACRDAVGRRPEPEVERVHALDALRSHRHALCDWPLEGPEFFEVKTLQWDTDPEGRRYLVAYGDDQLLGAVIADDGTISVRVDPEAA